MTVPEASHATSIHTVLAHTSPEAVWDALTDPVRMVRWMAEPELGLVVDVDWTVGGRIRLDGHLHVDFTTHGTVLAVDRPNLLRWTQLSSVSRLPDVPENHATVEVRLAPVPTGTQVEVEVTAPTTRAIQPHMDRYWHVAVDLLREEAERGV